LENRVGISTSTQKSVETNKLSMYMYVANRERKMGYFKPLQVISHVVKNEITHLT